GDIVGVGCLVDSCGTCNSCQDDLENYCEGPNGPTGTYNGNFAGTLDNTYGGYSSKIVVDEDFVLKISHNRKDLPAVAPLLCAGITTYSPLRHWQVGTNKKVGIVGIGGLGHMAVKLAKAMRAEVVAFTSSIAKVNEIKKLGADEVVVSKDPAQMQKHFRSFDFILNTVASAHNLDDYINLLKRDATMTMVGAPAHPHPSPTIFSLIFGRRSIAGSLIGGIKETQEMLDFCSKHNIVSDIEMIAMAEIENAYERMLKSDVKYRFVIDMATL
ncbi:MAG: NAD(P)-dependent alcohol dehydrogenase, partial [Alphaproteobacteria bacterium]